MITYAYVNVHVIFHEIREIPDLARSPKTFVFKGLLTSLLCSIFVCLAGFQEAGPNWNCSKPIRSKNKKGRLPMADGPSFIYFALVTTQIDEPESVRPNSRSHQGWVI